MTAEMTTLKTWRTPITGSGTRSATTSTGSDRRRRRWGKSSAVKIGLENLESINQFKMKFKYWFNRKNNFFSSKIPFWPKNH